MFSANIARLPLWQVSQTNARDVQPLEKTDSMLLNNIYEPFDISYIGSLLSLKQLPTDIVNYILGLAGCVLECRAETNEYMSGSAPLNMRYLSLIIPFMDYSSLEILGNAALILECVSNDQGWASDAAELNHSYQGSWSWIEYEILKSDGSLLMPRQAMCYNFRAERNPRRHFQYITDQNILSSLVRGAQISLYLRAQYPGWANYASYGRISLVSFVGLTYDIDITQELKKYCLRRINRNSSKQCCLS
ncbi:hypothetical protein THRCLA_23134 [Thraustotheca clavata]|uniref:Uncharacterized protein n=1 Tax=Thraustotheca clavata TaxID=74557 RepID=A0A1V9YD67_9STRA|nr:hypothetical protein THRCLA_23134 [Thraustotheca clavata]